MFKRIKLKLELKANVFNLARTLKANHKIVLYTSLSMTIKIKPFLTLKNINILVVFTNYQRFGSIVFTVDSIDLSNNK